MHPAAPTPDSGSQVPDSYHLPLALVAQYLFFLTRRPISSSNLHFLDSRLRGLRSLAPLLEASGDPQLEHVAQRLAALRPASFRRLSPEVQLSLLPLATANRSLPGDLVVEDGEPEVDWLDGVQRVLLVLGPGIGIGDELIFAPLPAWLKARRPELEITTLSGYRGLWDGIASVDHRTIYSDYLALLEALRGAQGPGNRGTLVIFGDFEHPALYPAIATENSLSRYLEISLGSRSAFLLDNDRRWLHRLHHVTPYFEGYYAGFAHTLRRLGLPADDRHRFHRLDDETSEAGLVRRSARPPTDRIQIFVSPFTSKYEPSEPYWSQLIHRMVPETPGIPVHIVLDTGKGERSERFARALRRSLRVHLPAAVAVDLAPPDKDSGLSLPGVFGLLESSHAVLCADSFCAHAGPLFGCVTLVLARAGLEPWRVPHTRSLYLDADAPVEPTAAAGRRLLTDLLLPPSKAVRDARFTPTEIRLAELAPQLREALAAPPGQTSSEESLGALWREVAEALPHALEAARWPEELAPVFHDPFFTTPERAWPTSSKIKAALVLHLRDRAERWLATNYCKVLEGVAGSPRDSPPDLERLPHSETPSSYTATADHDLPSAPTNAQGRERLTLRALHSLGRERLPTGEIACHWRTPRLPAAGENSGEGSGSLEYLQSPILSTFVHDALGVFDLTSTLLEPQIFDTFSATLRGQLARAAAERRRAIRRFLAWMEGNDGTWRLFGRAPGQPADLDTTACAATCLLEAPRRRFVPPGRHHLAAVLRLIEHEPPGDLAVSANALRFLALAGADPKRVDTLADQLLEKLGEHGLKASERYPEPAAVAYCLARAWRQGHLERRNKLRDLLAPKLERLLTPDGGTAQELHPLIAALAAGALLDLGARGALLHSVYRLLEDTTLPTGGWVYAPLVRAPGPGSSRTGGAPAASTAIGLSVILRIDGAWTREAA